MIITTIISILTKTVLRNIRSGIRSIINVSSKSGYCISQLIQDGKEINDPQKMANIFNKFFVNVSQKVTSGIARTRKCPLDYLKQRNDKSLFYLMLLLKKLKP